MIARWGAAPGGRYERGSTACGHSPSRPCSPSRRTPPRRFSRLDLLHPLGFRIRAADPSVARTRQLTCARSTPPLRRLVPGRGCGRAPGLPAVAVALHDAQTSRKLLRSTVWPPSQRCELAVPRRRASRTPNLFATHVTLAALLGRWRREQFYLVLAPVIVGLLIAMRRPARPDAHRARRRLPRCRSSTGGSVRARHRSCVLRH